MAISWKALTLLGAFAWLLMTASAGLSDPAEHVYQWRGPSEFVFFDNCGAVPQMVSLSGTGSGMSVDHPQPDGSFHVFVHYNDHMTGVGADGTVYRFSRTIERWIDFSPSGDETGMNAELRFRLTSQGQAPNGVLTHRFRLVTDANGNVVVDRETYEYSCSGAGTDDPTE